MKKIIKNNFAVVNGVICTDDDARGYDFR